MAIPLVDGVVTELESRFSDVARRASKLLRLVPSILVEDSFNLSDLDDAIEQYEDDIPNPDSLPMEITMWRNR